MATKLSKKYSIAAASALLVGGAALVVAPANAASVVLNYDCDVPIVGQKVFTVVADTDAPATLAANTSVGISSTAQVTVPADLIDLMRGILGARFISGTSDVKQSLNGVESTNVLAIARTAVPASGAMTVPAAGPGGTLPAGTVGQTYTITAGDFLAKMVIEKADGSTQNFDIPCVVQAGQDVTVDTVTVADQTTPPTTPPTTTPTTTPPTTPPATTPTTAPTTAPTVAPVVKADSSTTAKAKYAAATKKATVKVAVKAATGSATGRVKVTLKKGSKKVKTVTVNLAGGKAKATFKKIAASGKYKVVVAYAGSSTTNASSARTSFKVS